MATTAATHSTLVLLTRLTKQTYRRALDDGVSMNPKQFHGLSTLRDLHEPTQQALGTALWADANTVVLMLNDLEEAGYAERRRDPKDRRRHIVVVTPKGEKALAEAEQRFDAIEQEALSNLSAAEREQLRDLLHRALDG